MTGLDKTFFAVAMDLSDPAVVASRAQQSSTKGRGVAVVGGGGGGSGWWWWWRCVGVHLGSVGLATRARRGGRGYVQRSKPESDMPPATRQKAKHTKRSNCSSQSKKQTGIDLAATDPTDQPALLVFCSPSQADLETGPGGEVHSRFKEQVRALAKNWCDYRPL